MLDRLSECQLALDDVLAASCLVVVAVVWVLVNVSGRRAHPGCCHPNHGLTVADLPAVAAVLVAGVLLLVARRDR